MTERNEIAENIANVRRKISEASREAGRAEEPRLVAVSKTKPGSAIREAFAAGQRDFGENYVQELVEKAKELEDLTEIRWHFIGHVQTNKVKQLVTAPHLAVVETVDSEKVARVLEKEWSARGGGRGGRQLDVMIQVNTSGEGQKSGVEPTKVQGLIDVIRTSCPSLRLIGLMTIGESESGERDFAELVRCRQAVSGAASTTTTTLELSMGMSSDFQLATRMGSTNVRIGSLIFGTRVYSSK